MYGNKSEALELRGDPDKVGSAGLWDRLNGQDKSKSESKTVGWLSADCDDDAVLLPSRYPWKENWSKDRGSGKEREMDRMRRRELREEARWS